MDYSQQWKTSLEGTVRKCSLIQTEGNVDPVDRTKLFHFKHGVNSGEKAFGNLRFCLVFLYLFFFFLFSFALIFLQASLILKD